MCPQFESGRRHQFIYTMNKKFLYCLAVSLLIAPLILYALFEGVSGILEESLLWAFFLLLLAAPLTIVLAVGRMYASPRLPKDVSWLWLAFFASWAFVLSNIVVLAARQSTMQYGTVMTVLDFIGFDLSYETVRLEGWVVLLAAIIAVALMFLVPVYAFRRNQRQHQ